MSDQGGRVLRRNGRSLDAADEYSVCADIQRSCDAAIGGGAGVASALFLGESLPPWKLTAAALVMAGLAINLLWPRLRAALAGRA